jgi:hypothetical protein
MVSFTGLQKKRYKIICEEKHFLLINTCFKVKLIHGYKADDALVEIKRRGEHIRTEDVLAKLEVGETNWHWF